MSKLQVLIYDALHSDKNDIRAKAESGLIQMRDLNPNQFFMGCADILSGEHTQPLMKQYAAVVMGRLLYLKTNDDVYYWDLVHKNQQGIIKNCLINTLVSDCQQLMKKGASTISYIAAIQIPRGEWQGLVKNLADNTTHSDLPIRNASITTLGYICQQLKENPNISQQTCEVILAAIVLGIRNNFQHKQIMETSLTALRNSFCFLHGLLKNKQYLDSVFGLLMEHMDINDQQRMRCIYEVLYEFAKYMFNELGDYYEQILKFTIAHIQNRNQITVFALELWQSIGTQYLQQIQSARQRVASYYDKINNYVLVASDKLLPQVMKCLLILNKDDFDFVEMRESALKTLQIIVEAGNKDVVDKITEGVSIVVNSGDQGQRQASALLFSALADYEDKDYVQNLFKVGFVYLYNLIKDPSEIVRKNTLNGFARLSEVFPNVFLNQQNIDVICQEMIALIKGSNQSQQYLAMSVLVNITEQDFQDKQSKQIKSRTSIASNPNVLLTKVVQLYIYNINHFQNSIKQLNERIISIIMNIVMSTNKKEVVVQLLQFLLDQYPIFYNKQNLADQQIILQSILTIIHTCVLAMADMIPMENMLPLLLQVLDKHLARYGVEQEGLCLIGALSGSYRRAFSQKLDYYWPYIEEGLNQYEQKHVFRAALSCVADISRNHQSKMIDKIFKIFPKLVALMKLSIDREAKISILSCFGDLVLGLKKYGQNFVDTLIAISNDCMEAVYKFLNIPSEQPYVEELKEALIEMYHCVVFAINDQNNVNAKLAQHYQYVATFIVRTCDKSLRPTISYMSICLYFLYDSSLFYVKNAKYEKEVDNILGSPQILDIVHNVQTVKNNNVQVQKLVLFIESRSKDREKRRY